MNQKIESSSIVRLLPPFRRWYSGRSAEVISVNDSHAFVVWFRRGREIVRKREFVLLKKLQHEPKNA